MLKLISAALVAEAASEAEFDAATESWSAASWLSAVAAALAAV
jgi:hypothetical protein